jgi:hypothetical protein
VRIWRDALHRFGVQLNSLKEFNPTREVYRMVNIEDAPRLRELCEKASKEYDHEKLIDLIRQINELLQKRRRNQGDPGKQASAFPGSTSLIGYLSS